MTAAKRKGVKIYRYLGNARFHRDTLKVPMIVAVDTGGTKTLVAVFDTGGQVVHEQKFPTPPDIHDYLETLTQTIDSLLSGTDATCLSVALPGVIVNGRMIYGGNLNWHDTDMSELLSNHYDCPIIVENDANLAGLAEARALRELPATCLYVTVSTGIGTGVITNGQINPDFSISEGGQMVLLHNDEFARWESFASGKAIHTKYGKLASEIDDPAVWQEIAFGVAQGLLVLCPILRPSVIVLGGGVGAHFDKFSMQLNALLDEHLLDPLRPQVVEAAHPEEAVIYGCYYHAIDSLAA